MKRTRGTSLWTSLYAKGGYSALDEMNKENSSAEREKNGAASSRTSAEQAAQMLAAALSKKEEERKNAKKHGQARARQCARAVGAGKRKPARRTARRRNRGGLLSKRARRTSLLLNVRSIKRRIKPTAKTGRAKNLRSPHPPRPRKSLRSRPRSVQGAYSSNFSIY